MLLTVNNLEVCYGVISALQGISLEIDSGEIVTLIGANGAGKTTLLRAISGLLSPRQGSIEFDGQPIRRLAPHEIVHRGISHVPEGRQIFANLTVRENLELGGFQIRSYEELRRRAGRCYSLFPVLAERREQRGGTLSGGEQQMLAIGRCLMGAPDLVMFDEPSLGLAPTVVQSVLRCVRDLNREGLTCVLVEQNVAVSLKLASRAYVLENGRITLSGTGEALLADDRVRQAYLGM